MISININDLLSNSFVISIDQQQYKSFVDVFTARGLTCPMPKKFIGYKLQNKTYRHAGFVKLSNVANCSFSHMALIKMAKCLNMPYICIFEEDAWPCINIQYELPYYLSEIPDNTDMIKLGTLGNEGKWKKNISEKFIQCEYTWGSHAYIIFNRYYDDYIRICEEQDIIADMTVMNAKDKNILQTKDILFVQMTKQANGSFYNRTQVITREYINDETMLTRFGIIL